MHTVTKKRSCKFCGVTEDTKHINRDNLCARCYRILEKVRSGVASAEEVQWHDDMCRFNIQHGMFVPIRQRRELAHLKPAPQWHCRRCGTATITNQDFGYKNYCVECADEMRSQRMERQKPRTSFRQRSDKGGKHLKDKAKI